MNRFTLLLLLSCILLIFFISYQQKRLETEQGISEFYRIKADTLGSSLTYYENRLKEQVAVSRSIEMTSEALRQAMKENQLDYLKEVKGLNRRLNNLESLIKVTAQVDEEFETPLDSARRFHYKTEFLESRGIVTDSTLQMHSLTVLVPLQATVLWQRQHWKLFGKRREWLPNWFGKKVYETQVVSKNPAVRITKMETIIKRK